MGREHLLLARRVFWTAARFVRCEGVRRRLRTLSDASRASCSRPAGPTQHTHTYIHTSIHTTAHPPAAVDQRARVVVDVPAGPGSQAGCVHWVFIRKATHTWTCTRLPFHRLAASRKAQ